MPAEADVPAKKIIRYHQLTNFPPEWRLSTKVRKRKCKG
ncbi:hypothetical protein MYIN104542_03050 [Mycobacterium intermedium]